MFGIGLPEMILILALALIVVGPDKLPDLARSLAKGLMDLKKTAEGLKQSLSEEGNPLDDIKPDLEEAARSFKRDLLDAPPYNQAEDGVTGGVNPPAENAAKAYTELMKTTGDNAAAPEVYPANGADAERGNSDAEEEADSNSVPPLQRDTKSAKE